MSPSEALILILAGIIAGSINSIAGGGTLVAFPAALAVLIARGASGAHDFRTATATTLLALTPGAVAAAWAYRRELEGHRRLSVKLAIPAAVGGVLGAQLLLFSGEALLRTIVPLMVLAACVLIVLKDVIWRSAHGHVQAQSASRTTAVGTGIFVVGAYSGYFGGGKNIMMLALLGLLKPMTIHQANALKSAIVALVTSLSSAYFLLRGVPDLGIAGVMIVGALLGSFGTAAVARTLNPTLVRYAVVCIGVSLSGFLAYKHWLTA